MLHASLTLLNTIKKCRCILFIFGICLLASSSARADISTNLVGHWTFDEGAGSTVYDVSGNGHDGALVNGPNWTSGIINGAIDLDIADDFIDVGSASTLDDIPVKTISAWIMRKDITRNQYIALKGFTGGPGGWELYIRRSTGGEGADRLGYNHQWSSSRWRSAMWYTDTELDQANTWYHIVVSYDATSAANTPVMYINGVAQPVIALNTARGVEASDAANDLTLGGPPGDSIQDDIRLYDRALSATEVQTLYSLGVPSPQCSDNMDNDGDGLIDFPLDPGCTGTSDDDETNATVDQFASLSSWSSFDPGANGVGINPDGFNGGVSDGRYIYFVSSYSPSTEILRFDTTVAFNSASSWASFDPGVGGYADAVFDGRYVYFVPYHATNAIGENSEVLRYDTTQPFEVAQSWSTFDAVLNGIISLGGYWGGIFDGRYIYFSQTADDGGEMLRYDTTRPFGAPSSWVAYDAGLNGVGVDPDGYKGVISDGRFVYFVPYWNGQGSHGEFLRYDSTLPFDSASSWITYIPGDNGVGSVAKGFEYALSDGRFIYFVPSYSGFGPGAYHGEVLRLDIQQSFTAASSWTAFDPGANGVGVDPDGFAGGHYDGRYIYLAPSNNGTSPHGEVLRFDTTSPFGVSSSWSAYDPAAKGLGVDPTGYAGTVAVGNYIYFIPDRNNSGWHGEFLRYDKGP